MTRRWMTVLMVLLAMAMVGTTTGCIKKKKKALDPNAGLVSDQVLLGYGPNGEEIWGKPGDTLPGRTESAEIGVGQFEAVYFDYDSPQLNPSEQGKVDAVVAYLQQNPTHGVVVEGHCDERGSNEYNLSLGENRALAVRSYLVNLGVAADRIQTRSYGEEKPAVAGSGEEAWHLNRRGEFALFQK